MKAMINIRTLAAAAESALGIDIVIAANGRAAYHAAETDEWYWLSSDDLRYAVACRAEHGSDAYSHWCAASGTLVRTRKSICELEG